MSHPGLGKYTEHGFIIQVRRTRHGRYFWGIKDEFKIDVLLSTPKHGRTSVCRPARTYQHQLCADIGCSLENLPEAMDDKDGNVPIIHRSRQESGKYMLAARLNDDDDNAVSQCTNFIKLS